MSLYNGYTYTHNGTNLYETDDSDRLILNQNLRAALQSRFKRANQVRIIEERVKELKDEPDPEDNPNIFKKKNLLKGLEKARIVAATQSDGIAIDTLDTSMALLFGNKTTVGQVCGYSKGLEIDGTALDGVHGFCCGDAPYQNDYWGELVSPTYVYPPASVHLCKLFCKNILWLTCFVPTATRRTQYSCTYQSGDKKGKGKNPVEDQSVCKNLAPWWSGFNVAACDSYSGAWCPYPRPCSLLKNCINDLSTAAKKKVTKQAFFRYLDDAPKIEDDNAANVEECGDLREYFEYDRYYYDDERICEEVENLQCFTDFSNLDGFATGSAGSAADEVLVISTKIVKKQGSKCTDADAFEYAVVAITDFSVCAYNYFFTFLFNVSSFRLRPSQSVENCNFFDKKGASHCKKYVEYYKNR